MAGGTETAMGRYSLVARFSARCGWEPREYTERTSARCWPRTRSLRHPVVLMHNQPAGNPATVAALPVIIRFFRSHGYGFVRLPGS